MATENGLPPEPAHEAWLTHSPLRAKMRAMWIDCGTIASQSIQPETADLASIECAADDIARKADQAADFWQAVKEANLACSGAGKRGDWDQASEKHHRIWKTCSDCHVENWRLQTRGFKSDTVEAWRGGYRKDVPWNSAYSDGLNAAPKENFHRGMRALQNALDQMAVAIEERKWSEMASHAKKLGDSCNSQINVWRGASGSCV